MSNFWKTVLQVILVALMILTVVFCVAMVCCDYLIFYGYIN